MTEPKTAAGRDLAHWLDWAHERMLGVPQSSQILAIEAEARAAALDEARAEVEAERVKYPDLIAYSAAFGLAVRAIDALREGAE